nr:MAG TPA: hypothetical protein [Caudoviricetes sp.]
MKIYEVIPDFGGPRHVVIVRNEEEAIEMTVKYLNQFHAFDLYKTSDFCVSAIDADKLSEPTIIN